MSVEERTYQLPSWFTEIQTSGIPGLVTLCTLQHSPTASLLECTSSDKRAPASSRSMTSAPSFSAASSHSTPVATRWMLSLFEYSSWQQQQALGIQLPRFHTVKYSSTAKYILNCNTSTHHANGNKISTDSNGINFYGNTVKKGDKVCRNTAIWPKIYCVNCTALDCLKLHQMCTAYWSATWIVDVEMNIFSLQ